MRSKADMRYAAYAGSLITAIAQFTTRRARDGTRREGYFGALADTLGECFTNEGRHLKKFKDSGLESAASLQQAWVHMQQEVEGSPIRGPLSECYTGRASRVTKHLQKEITKQREAVAAHRLKEEMLALMHGPGWAQTKPGDYRANAGLQCDAFSAQLLQALPNKYYCLSPSDFADSLSRYLGAPIYSLMKEKLVGQPIPCSWNGVRGRGVRRCDAHGHELELATISDNSHWRESTAIEKAIYDSMRYAGLEVKRQDNLTFRGLVGATAADGARPQERAPLVPDLRAELSYDGGKTPAQEYIFDVKTLRLSGSTEGYKVRESYEEPHGAVDRRAASVPKEYLQKARKADAEHARRATNQNHSDSDMEADDLDMALGDTHDQDQAQRPGPVESKLREMPAPVGLCFGAYCEASEEVHKLAKVVAACMVEKRGGELGCDKDKCKGVFEQRLRQAWAMAAVRAKAKAREERKPLVGLSTKAQADRLLGSSMAGCWQPDTALPGHQQMALLDAMVWPEDAGAGLSREERRGG
jgi:hypothetical protein